MTWRILFNCLPFVAVDPQDQRHCIIKSLALEYVEEDEQSSDDTMSEDEDIESESSDEQAIEGDEWHMLKEIVRVKVTKKYQDYYQKVQAYYVPVTLHSSYFQN